MRFLEKGTLTLYVRESILLRWMNLELAEGIFQLITIIHKFLAKIKLLKNKRLAKI